MTLRLTQLRFAAVALFAAAVASTASPVAVPSARAFTMENLSTNGGNTTRFADPNDRVKNFDSQGTPAVRPKRANNAVRRRPTL